MKAKLSLKAVESGQDGRLEYTSEQISTIAEQLYFARAVLDVLSCLNTAQPDAFECGSVNQIALEAKIKINEALKILNP